ARTWFQLSYRRLSFMPRPPPGHTIPPLRTLQRRQPAAGGRLRPGHVVVTMRRGIRKTGDNMRFILLASLALLLLPAVASAQTLPRPAEFYFDEDVRTIRAITAIEGDDEATQQRLLRMIE